MEWLWIIAAVIVVIVVVVILVRTAKQWTSIKSEGGSRADRIDRMHAYLKAQGVKSKISPGAANTVQLKVKKQNAKQAKELIEAFEQEE